MVSVIVHSNKMVPVLFIILISVTEAYSSITVLPPRELHAVSEDANVKAAILKNTGLLNHPSMLFVCLSRLILFLILSYFVLIRGQPLDSGIFHDPILP